MARIESPEINGTTYSTYCNLEYDNGGSWDHWGKGELFISCCWENWRVIYKNIKPDPFSPHTRVVSNESET